jgi:hypothetical protein
MYDVHDGKMLYLLTYHSLYNRCHYPFLLCKCKRGAGVVDEKHKCEMLTQEEQVEKLEHLRWLKAGWQMGCSCVEFNGIEINSPEELEQWNERSR